MTGQQPPCVPLDTNAYGLPNARGAALYGYASPDARLAGYTPGTQQGSYYCNPPGAPVAAPGSPTPPVTGQPRDMPPPLPLTCFGRAYDGYLDNCVSYLAVPTDNSTSGVFMAPAPGALSNLTHFGSLQVSSTIPGASLPPPFRDRGDGMSTTPPPGGDATRLGFRMCSNQSFTRFT